MNKDVNFNLKIEETKTTRYFQPVITNNTVIIPAKRLQENVSETKEDAPKAVDTKFEGIVEKIDRVEYKNLSTDNSTMNVTYKNLSNSFEESKIDELKLENLNIEEPKVDELKIEEIIIEESKINESKVEEPQVEELKIEEITIEEEKEFRMKLEDMAKIFEQSQIRDFEDEDIAKENADLKNEEAEIKVENNLETKEVENQNKIDDKDALNKDDTKKMDIPFVEGLETESVPQRREIVDNLSEMKSKLFLLASNAKKPVRICVNKKVFLMGSDYAKMDCVIRNNRYISRCHSKIYYEAGCYFIEDVGSMNGTYINGVKLAEGIKYKLETGDLINLADCKFEVDIKN